MTTDISSNDPADPTAVDATGQDRTTDLSSRFLLAGTLLFVLGLVITTLAVLKLVLPSLLAGSDYTNYGRMIQSGGTLLADGWLPIAGLGLALWVLTQITDGPIRRRGLAMAALGLMALGAFAGAGDLIGGLSSGVAGQEAPIWTRGISSIGYLLAAVVVTSTAKSKPDQLGASGWYLTAAFWWLAASSLYGLIPLSSGTAGAIQAGFADAGLHRLFAMSLAVGLLYFTISRLAGADPAEPRPLSALGFWSLSLTWAFMGGAELIYSAVPNWYETITASFAIGTFVAVFAIVTDLGLLLKGHVREVGDRATLRYSILAGFALIAATAVNFLLIWRATSAVVQHTTWSMGLDMLIVLGGGSFAIFAANSLRRGGRGKSAGLHFIGSVIGLAGVAVGLLAGGVVVGFSWIAGPASQLFPNYGPGWEISVASATPFLWITAVSLIVYLDAQAVYLLRLGSASGEQLGLPDGPIEYDLQFEGSVQYATWKRLTWGAAAVWIAALLFTSILPALDGTDTDPTIVADTARSFPSGSSEAAGRDLYISEGCSECHTQSVRPIVADVGLGAVSVAGDYAYEQPVLISGTRFGPDLTHWATRYGPVDAAATITHLKHPRAVVAWSTMPSYSYLSEADLNALVSYLETLR